MTCVFSQMIKCRALNDLWFHQMIRCRALNDIWFLQIMTILRKTIHDICFQMIVCRSLNDLWLLQMIRCSVLEDISFLQMIICRSLNDTWFFILFYLIYCLIQSLIVCMAGVTGKEEHVYLFREHLMSLLIFSDPVI